MSLRVARGIIMQEEFDSAALTPLCYLVHFVQEPGLYIGEVKRGADVAGTFRIQAVGDGAAGQVNVDLASVRGALEARLVLAPGVIVFYPSSGTIGYSVKLWRTEGARRRVEFDSKKLGAEDLFAVTLLHPGDYDVTDEADRSLCRLSVSSRRPGKKPYRSPAPALASLSDEAIAEAASGQLRQAQTQVFRAEGRPRIKVRLHGSLKEAAEPAPAKVLWRSDGE